jgi:hypothetical protein
LLLLVTLSGVLCLVPAMAARGHLWAVAASVALFGALLLLVVQGLLLLATQAVGRLVKRRAAAARN